MRGWTTAIVGSVLCVLSLASDARAQAWVPDKGEGSVAVLYQNLLSEEHLLANGARIDRGHIRSNNLVADFTYGITDRIALMIGVPYFRPRYSGASPHPTPQDDGRAHGGFQDVRFKLRYRLTDGPLTVTPFVATNVPTHDYEYFAHASLGARVRELDVGAYVGRVLGPVLPNTFVQARYSYSFAERIAGVHRGRSNFDFEVGHFITPGVRVFALSTGQKTHGGLDLPDAGWRAMPPELAPHHDRIARIDMYDLGGGVQASLTRSLDLFASYTTTLSGRNSHALKRAITIGAAWSFGGRIDLLQASNDTARDESLVKCLCQK